MGTRFEPKKINLNRINGGIAYENGDTPQPHLFNDVAQNSAYCAEQIEAILHPPEVVETDPNLPPTVEWVRTYVNGRAYQKLRFSNLKGASGNGQGNGSGTTTIPDIDGDTIIRNTEGKIAVNVPRVTINGVPKDLSNIQQVSDTDVETQTQRDSGKLYVDFNGQPRKISISQIAAPAKTTSYVRAFTKDDFVKVGNTYVLSILSVDHGLTNPYLAELHIDKSADNDENEQYTTTAICVSRVMKSGTVKIILTIDLSEYTEYSGKIYLNGE